VLIVCIEHEDGKKCARIGSVLWGFIDCVFLLTVNLFKLVRLIEVLCSCNTFKQSEAIPESLKNMLLVMHTAGILQHSDENDDSKLWKLTWDRIDAFLPSLREEVFKPHEPGLCFYLIFAV
jgi:hypothetical protein